MTNPLTPRDATAGIDFSNLYEQSNLTRAQLLIWLGSQVNAQAPLYNMIHATAIHGSLDAGAFEQAFTQLVGDTQVLQTVVTVRDGIPSQRQAPDPVVAHATVDFSAGPDPQRAADEWLEQERKRVLQLDQCLHRSALLRIGPDCHIWYLCLHHLVCDAQSFALLHTGLAERYRAAVGSAETAVEPYPAFSDYLTFERRLAHSDRWQRAQRYWQEQIDAAARVDSFYGVAARGSQHRTRRYRQQLSADDAARLRAIAQQPGFAGISESTTLAGLWTTLLAVFLHRISGTSALSIGTPLQGRPKAAFKATPGAFVEVGVLNVQIEPDDSFASVYGKVQDRMLRNLAAALPGFGSAAMNRSYTTLINYVTARFGDFAGLPARTEWLHSGFGDSEHALRLQVCDFDDAGPVTLLFDLNDSVFSAERARWLQQQFAACLAQFLESPEGSIGDFDLLAGSQLPQLQQRFNATECSFADGEQPTVVSLFERQVQQTPDAIAVIDGEQQLTFAALNARANQVAALLRERDCAVDSRIAICLPRSAALLAAIWGALKAGAAYCPIDPQHPLARRLQLLDDLQPQVLLTNDDLAPPLKAHAQHCISVDQRDLSALAASNPPIAASAKDPAYLMYTSGSTGAPKAAILGHGGLANYVQWVCREHLQGQPRDFALYSSIAFDLTVTSLFVPSVCGAAIRIYPESEAAPGLEVLDVFADDAVDVVKLTPAHLQLLVQQGMAPERIRTLILGGEDLNTQLALTAQQQCPELRLLNEYGPTEATVGCMLHCFDAQRDTAASVPLGTPAANMRIELVDDYGQRVPEGVTGEMVLHGPGVGLGYWRQPALTAQLFTGNGAHRAYRSGDMARWQDGALVFLGRRDEQIKLRGVRIETAEIEATLLQHPQVQGALVQLWQPGDATAAQHCQRCGLSSRYPDAQFDAHGICTDCRDFERYEGEVQRYFGSAQELRTRLQHIQARHAAQPYDCIALTSGGKDSTYMLYQLVREFGARPLVFTLDNGYISERALRNVREACADLGLDLEVGQTEHMAAIFADSLQRHCNVCNGCFKTIYTLSLSLARQLGLSTIVTGLSRGQLFETRLADTFKARQFDPEAIDALVTDARKVYHRVEDAVYELIETRLFESDDVFDEVEFLDFYRYVDVGLDVVYDYLDHQTVWQRPIDTGRSTNCLINDAGIYVHQRVRGYHNYSLPYGWDVRLGHKTRETAMAELDDDIDVERVRAILSEIGYDDAPLRAAQQPRLVAWYAAPAEVSARELREHVVAALPAHMVPAQFVRLEALPLTGNGKIDRRALPDPAQAAELTLAAPYVAASNPVQQQLVTLWQQLLGIERVGVDDNFFALGGDSVSCIQVAAAAQRLGLPVVPAQVFAHPTVATLAAVIDAQQADAPSTEAAPRWRPDAPTAALLQQTLAVQQLPLCYPLTPAQTGMLYHSLAAEAGDLYVGQISACFDGPLDFDALAAAYRDLVAANDVLRTRFVWQGLDEPVQVVMAAAAPAWTLLDWRHRGAADCARALTALAARIRADGLPLESGVPLQMTLVRESDERTHMIWSSHHMLFDGWSTYPLLSQWLAHYQRRVGAGDSGPQPPRPFVDYVSWLHAQDPAPARAFWSEYLQGMGEPLTLPIAQSLSVGQRDLQPSALRLELDMQLDAAASQGLQALARSRQVTLNAVFCSAWAIVLSRYCRTDDVVFGSTWSGRNAALPGIEAMIGLFLNTLPLRLQPPSSGAFADWLPIVQQQLVAIAAHESAPLSEIQQLAGGSAAQALFESIVVFENYPDHLLALPPGVDLSALRFEAPSHYPLALLVYPGAPLRICFVFDEARFSRAQVSALAGHLQQLLTAIAEQPDRPIAALPMLTEREARQLRGPLCRSEPLSSPPPSLLQRLDALAVSQPEAIAVRCAGQSLDYRALQQRTVAVATELQRRGVGIGARVGIWAERSADTVVAMLAALRAGAAFVPIAPDAPAVHITQLLRDADAALLLASGPVPAAPASVVVLDPRDCALTESAADLLPQVPGSALAYVLYTSGSSGRPKGVMVSHDNLLASLAARQQFYQPPVDVFLHLSSFAFDSALAGLFWTLADGGTLLLPDPQQQHDIAHLLALNRTHSVTHLLALPSLYGALLEGAADDSLAALTTAVVAGESCTPALVAAHFRRVPHGELFNEYGPTEATIWSHVYQVPRDFAGASVPIGRPIAGMEQFVVDGSLQPVPIGVPGELLLAGPGIAQGYLADPEQTAARFTALPASLGSAHPRGYRTGDLVALQPDGSLLFLGRLDRQLKLRGYRVEPEQIESVIGTLAGVGSVAVSGTHRAYPRQLIALYEGSADAAALTTALAQRLPDYLVPSLCQPVAVLPRLSNGKLDRQAIDQMRLTVKRPGNPHRPPTTPRARLLCQLCAEVLDRESVSMSDGFVQLGGDSVAALRLAAKLHRAGYAVRLQDIVGAADFDELEAQLQDSTDNPTVLVPASEDRTAFPLSPFQQRLWFIEHLYGTQSAQVIYAAYRIRGALDLERLRAALDAVASRHEILRTVFHAEAELLSQRVLSEPDIAWQVESLPAGASLTELLTTRLQAPLSLTERPPWQAHLIETDDARLLLLRFHHMVMDGESMPVLLRELSSAYTDPDSVRTAQLPAPVQYGDVARWQSDAVLDDAQRAAFASWLAEFQGELPVLDLPLRGPRPAQQSFAGAHVHAVLEPEERSAVIEFAQGIGATAAEVLLAAYTAMLLRYSDQAEVIIGMPVDALRYRANAQSGIGPYLNTAALRMAPDPDASFAQLLGYSQGRMRLALERASLPFERFVSELGLANDLTRSPVFQSLFAYRSTRADTLTLDGLAVDSETIDSPFARTDVALWLLDDGERLRMDLEYCAALFEPALMTQFVADLKRLLLAALSEAQQPVATLARPLALPAPSVGPQAQLPDATVLDLIAAVAARHPERIAVSGSDGTLTYAQLLQRAAQLAAGLRRAGVGAGDLVALAVTRTEQLPVAVLGVFAAGAAYVPLDLSQPADRLQLIVEDAGAQTVLVDDDAVARLPEFQWQVLNIAHTLVPEASGLDPDTQPGPAALAYVMFTSGSTGRPKGVAIGHRQIVNLLTGFQAQVGLQPSDVLAAVTTVTFDISVLELLWPLTVGACCHVVAEEVLTDGRRLASELARSNATVMQATPATWRLLLDAGWQGDQALRALCGGDTLPLSLAQKLTQCCAQLWNLYGPTETTVWSALARVDAGVERIEIGQPLQNTGIYVVDALGQPVPEGVQGELAIAGDGLAIGYLGQPELTAQRFIESSFAAGNKLYLTGDVGRWLPNGQLQHLGRRDGQIKLRGFRIEVGEVEFHLERMAGVVAAAVAKRVGADGEEYLAAFVVAEPDAQLDVLTLRRALRQAVPTYMVPQHIGVVPQLPQTPNKKIDRKALQRIAIERIGRERASPPQTPMEQLLAEIWCDLLDINSVSTDEDFIAAGGHSLLVIKLLGRVQEQTGAALEARAVFLKPLRELATLLEAQVPASNDAQAVAAADVELLVQAPQRRSVWQKLLGKLSR